MGKRVEGRKGRGGIWLNFRRPRDVSGLCCVGLN